jgi:formylglycine-generating enzyme required for sulfatase activity
MAGNVWEWTADRYTERHDVKPCCGPRDDRPDAHIPRRVTKGGSHLCAPNYCLRYRPAARQGQSIDSSTSHIGFRCVVREPG